MKSDPGNLKVSILSTSEDLDAYRAVARLEVLNQHWVPEMMEHFGTSVKRTVDACYEKLSTSDLAILIVGFRRGWVPTEQEGGDGHQSITALELDYAHKHSIPVLVFMASDTWPGKLYESEQEGRDWVEHFRQGLNQPAVFFDFERPTLEESQRLPAFRAKLSTSLADYKKTLLEELSKTNGNVGPDYSISACEDLLDGASIPFIGAGVYGEGPLSTPLLIKSLGEGLTEDHACLATAAEYRERYHRRRAPLLNHLCRILKDQSSNLETPAVYELLSRIENLTLVVSLTYDQVFEDLLRKCGKSFVVVTHVIHSYQGEHDGKVLVFKDNKPATLCLSDKVDLLGEKLIVYKPLGSPLLHDQLDPELELDTVVITENDHLTFLGRLENQHTKIPTAFTRKFQRSSLLFLGYAMDVWHYRLVTQVFELLGFRRLDASTLAVRQPATVMEELAWQRLRADLIQRDPNEFAMWVMDKAVKGLENG